MADKEVPTDSAFHRRVFDFIHGLYPGRTVVGLHEPVIGNLEKARVLEALDSGYVSSVGAFVNRLEDELCRATGAAHAVAVVNGTAGIHAALAVLGVEPGEEVLTQALTFVATANAIRYQGAEPVFLDVTRETLGLSPESLVRFLETGCEQKEGVCRNRETGRKVAACLPVHGFGHPCRVDEIAHICGQYGIPVIEDAAEALGSRYKGRSCGTFGTLGVFSFNGNKIVTAGGGGAVVTNDAGLAETLRHLTTTAKKPHAWEYVHDRVGFNYRLPNLNAALASAQLEQLDEFVENKRNLARQYGEFFHKEGVPFIVEPSGARSNYWLNAVLLPDRTERDCFLAAAKEAGIQCRPVWRLLNRLPMYKDCPTPDGLPVSRELEARIVNLPSSVRG